MLGTIINTCAIITGTIIGSLLHTSIKEKYKNTIYDGLGLVCLALGINASISHFKESEFPVLFVLAIAIGGVVGTRLDIDNRFQQLTKKKSKGDTRLGQGLSTAILLFCVGPLSILGPVMSAVHGDNTFLYTNATLDLVSSMIFASTYGMGIIFSAPVLFLWQGTFYLIASLSHEAIHPAMMADLLIVGGLLITASGLSLLGIKNIKTLNYLPALLVPVIWYLVSSLL